MDSTFGSTWLQNDQFIVFSCLLLRIVFLRHTSSLTACGFQSQLQGILIQKQNVVILSRVRTRLFTRMNHRCVVVFMTSFLFFDSLFLWFGFMLVNAVKFVRNSEYMLEIHACAPAPQGTDQLLSCQCHKHPY